ncbi:hypothetical protein [Microvirga calopogonii]|uniref:hypothetical protein n=1 Tax=Microvirga calopogonii TaxID=2078013 RepID=UPI000E0CD789|nr:hypothetical protein [Microvirga calopogonii]
MKISDLSRINKLHEKRKELMNISKMLPHMKVSVAGYEITQEFLDLVRPKLEGLLAENYERRLAQIDAELAALGVEVS